MRLSHKLNSDRSSWARLMLVFVLGMQSAGSEFRKFDMGLRDRKKRQ